MTQLKRLKYISEFAEFMPSDEIDRLVTEAEENNKKLDITGILIASGQMFFQVIEGPGHHVDMLYEAICKDTRHRNVHLLKSEWGVVDRMFPNWSMKQINLDSGSSARMEPLKAILEIIIENQQQISTLSQVLERAIWEAFSESV